MLSELHQIITKDGIPLEGLLFKPKRKKRAAAVWLGGLTSRFSKNPERTHALAQVFTKHGIAFANFDHRGAGIINAIKIQKGNRKKYILAGTSFEKFEHSIFDIEAILNFFRKRGYKKIFLLGHSTGANKVAYYILKRGSQGISGAALLGPLSDIPIFKSQLGKKYRLALNTARKMINNNKRKELLPFSVVNKAFWGAERFWSLAREKSNEDMFPYYDPKRKFRWTKNVRVPILVVIGENEQYADRPVKEIMNSFKTQISGRWFTGAVIKGADHSFTGKEKVLASKIIGWITL